MNRDAKIIWNTAAVRPDLILRCPSFLLSLRPGQKDLLYLLPLSVTVYTFTAADQPIPPSKAPAIRAITAKLQYTYFDSG